MADIVDEGGMKQEAPDVMIVNWEPVAGHVEGVKLPVLPGRLTPTSAVDRGPFKVRCGHCHAVLLSGWSETALQRVELAACWKCGGTSAYASLRSHDL